jgi:hypothetical protein
MRSVRLAILGLVLLGCSDRGAVTFELQAPTNALFNPVAQPQLVSEYDIRTASGTVVGIASAVQDSQSNFTGLLPLGPLMPISGPTDVVVTALSGANLLGMARIKDVTIKSGLRATYTAQLRKPIIFVGSTLPAESDPKNQTLAVEIIDPIASTDLARTGTMAPAVLGGMSAGATTWDGRFLVMAQGTQLGAFDTGKGLNVTGSLTLPFAPSRIVTSPRELAVAALDPGNGTSGSVAIFSDVNSLTGNPANATANMVTVRGVARTAAFSPDGNRLYVLTGVPTEDPCSPGAQPAANSIIAFGLDGSMTAMYNLPSFAADIAVDAASGTLVIADAAAHQLSTLDPSSAAGPVTPRKLVGGLNCPSAVRVVNGIAFAVTSDRDNTQPNAFLMQRVTLASGEAMALSFVGPQYQISTGANPSSNGDVQSNTVQVRPVSLWAYDLALTPDGSRAEFAVRAHYVESGTTFNVIDATCTATFDIVEYGLYAVDLRSGNASYAMRSQLTQMPANQRACIDCPVGAPLPDITFDCPSHPGDRPAGVAAVFGP